MKLPKLPAVQKNVILVALTLAVGLSLVAWALRPSNLLAERCLVKADDDRPPWIPEEEGAGDAHAEPGPDRLLLKNSPAGYEILWSTSASLYGDDTLRRPETIPSARY